ncbi:8-oxo-dGDP phosphatase NUDT18-like [Ptychodera flava]|uniref:8-oxo-dGDP phosphatase NUDT18-like n=1 Tax=Ptychodera flava TaxID=63121 RepID=UPI003969E4E3
MAEAENIESYIEKCLDGKLPSVTYPDCDTSLGISTNPVLRQNVTYIVAAVLFNENGDVLFIQEAKETCRGRWYLPAGRVNRNETLEEAVKREVLEEAGVEFEPRGITCVESSDGFWIRVTFTGPIVDGKVKTLNEADEESLQASWFAVKKGMPIRKDIQNQIRSYDIIQLILTAVAYRESSSKPQVLPILNPYNKVCFRTLIVVNQSSENAVPKVLLLNGHLQLVDIFCTNPMQLIEKVAQDAFGEPVQCKLAGALAVEHVGKPHGKADGICITCLVSVETDKAVNHPLCQLCPLTKKSLQDEIFRRLEDKRIPFLLR